MITKNDLIDLIDDEILRDVSKSEDLVSIVKKFLNQRLKRLPVMNIQFKDYYDRIFKDKIIMDPEGFISIAELKDLRRRLPKISQKVLCAYLRGIGLKQTRMTLPNGIQSRVWIGARLPQ